MFVAVLSIVNRIEIGFKKVKCNFYALNFKVKALTRNKNLGFWIESSAMHLNLIKEMSENENVRHERSIKFLEFT